MGQLECHTHAGKILEGIARSGSLWVYHYGVRQLPVLFMMIGQLSMGLLLSYSAVWWALPVTALALIGYFLLPGIFYLWMGLLVGGGMIALGIYIRARW